MVASQIFGDITLIQILIIIFALFAWSRAMLRLKDKNISLGEFLFWSVLWIAVILIALFPTLIGDLSQIVGVGRAVDMVVYVSIIVLFYLVFRLYVFVDSKNREITTLVRELAIRDAKHKDVKESKDRKEIKDGNVSMIHKTVKTAGRKK